MRMRCGDIFRLREWKERPDELMMDRVFKTVFALERCDVKGYQYGQCWMDTSTFSKISEVTTRIDAHAVFWRKIN
jgi:hypothetical protein